MKTPELDKQLEVRERAQAIGEFVEEFLREKGIALAETHQHSHSCYTEGYTPTEFRQRYQKVSDRSRALGRLSWEPLEVSEQVWNDGKHNAPKCGIESGSLFPTHYSIAKLLAEFFEIDLNKIETERRALEEIRSKSS